MVLDLDGQRGYPAEGYPILCCLHFSDGIVVVVHATRHDKTQEGVVSVTAVASGFLHPEDMSNFFQFEIDQSLYEVAYPPEIFQIFVVLLYFRQ